MKKSFVCYKSWMSQPIRILGTSNWKGSVSTRSWCRVFDTIGACGNTKKYCKKRYFLSSKKITRGPNPRGDTISASRFGPPGGPNPLVDMGRGGPNQLADLVRGDHIHGYQQIGDTGHDLVGLSQSWVW